MRSKGEAFIPVFDVVVCVLHDGTFLDEISGLKAGEGSSLENSVTTSYIPEWENREQ